VKDDTETPPLDDTVSSDEAISSDDAIASDDAFREGVDAYDSGLDRSYCRHPHGSDRRELWLAGFDHAEEAAEIAALDD
jgi:hypothetical protein